MLKRLWILGHGRILVDGQFLVDYSRLRLFLDDRPMPKCVRDGTKLLFERLGSDYYVFTKYMNQTLGNMCFETLRKLTSSKHLVLRHHTLVVKAYTCTKKVVCSFVCLGLDSHLVTKHRFHVKMVVNLRTYDTVFECSI